MSKLTFLKPLPLKEKIRIGWNHDGGYVVYGRLLAETDVLVTYGVGWDVYFEEQFNQLTAKPVLMFDPTMFGRYLTDFGRLKKQVFSLRFKAAYRYLLEVRYCWWKIRQLKARNIIFLNEGIASRKAYKYDTFDSHIQRFGLKEKQILLKIDIEGGEYDVFKDAGIYDHLPDVNQILIEFHDLKNRLRDVEDILTRLGKDFELVHIHCNNTGGVFVLPDLLNAGGEDITVPNVIEVTLVKRKKILAEDILDQPVSYPVAHLDFPNDPARQDYIVSFI